MWNTFFAFFFDFSMALPLLKIALTFFAVIIFMLFYCHTWKLYAEEFDKLLHALTMSSKGSSLDIVMEWLILHLAYLHGGLRLGALST